MGLIELNYEDGQTPLDEDEREGLLIAAVVTKSELDEVEQRNIEDAMRWIAERRRKLTSARVLSEKFITEVHKKMFGEVWKWAGTFRNTNKNIGVDKYQIGVSLKMLLDDCSYWIANNTYSPDEIAIRFKHRIVAVHCFANGNGRHSRLMADIIIEKLLSKELFTWGSASLMRDGGKRQAYLKALREADAGDYEPLILFAKS